MIEKESNVIERNDDSRQPLLFTTEELKPTSNPYYDYEYDKERRIAQKSKMNNRSKK